MASLTILQGPNTGRSFALDAQRSLIGRRPDSTVFLESLAVSREHAEILCDDGAYAVRDLGSSNGTYVNGQRVTESVPLTEQDALHIGPYTFGLRAAAAARPTEAEQVIRTQVNAVPSNLTLYTQNPALKLQVVLEIARHLARTLEMEPLLGKLLDHLLRLFPQADRGMILLQEHGQLVVRAQRARGTEGPVDYPYSRTIVRKALEDGVGILSEDVGGDQRFVGTATLMRLNLRSFLCVPLITPEGTRLGVIHLDCSRPGYAFHGEDLELLTAIGMQASVVLENAALHAELLREERFRQELQMAREIQQSFLPADFASRDGYELFAQVHPAREVSGDLYDFFPLADGRLAFCVGDVAGKGMPAALFMVKVQTLTRHLAPLSAGPAETLNRLNGPLVADNPTVTFVTMAAGAYDPASGRLALASAGHPAPLLRRPDGTIEEVSVPSGRPVGCLELPLGLEETSLTLQPGETLILYTDGFAEAFGPDRKEQFGVGRLRQVLGGANAQLPLAACAEEARAAVERFTGSTEQQDDLTLLLLRRR
jgi:serine phosphatase RsbU (regulator of sigma subunit)